MNGKQEHSHGFSSPLSAEKTGPESEAPLTDANKQSGSSPTPDFSVRDEGSLFLLTPLSVAAREFVDERIGSENGFQPYWPTVVIERRYAQDILEGVIAEGMVIA